MSATPSRVDEYGQPVVACQGCGGITDPSTCHCGDAIVPNKCHSSNHSAVPIGCICGYASSPEVLGEKIKNMRERWQEAEAINADLLAALELLVEDCKDQEARGISMFPIGPALAAIAKARGEQP